MKFWITAALILFFGPSVPAQVTRPGALDSEQVCSGLTCVWTADSEQHARVGTFEAFLQPRGATTQERDVSPTDLVVLRESKVAARIFLKDLRASVTLTWALDYNAFAVTWSDGGSIGNFHTRVFRRVDETFVEVPAVARAFRHFKAEHACKTRGDNVQAWRFEGHA